MRPGYSLLIFFMLCLNTTAQAADWRLYKSNPPVQIEYRQTAQQLLEIKAETTVQSTLGAFLHLLEDTGQIKRWVEHAESATLLEQPDPQTHLVYTRFDATWPVSKRDMVTRSVWSQDEDTLQLRLEIMDLAEEYELVAGYIRMRSVKALWLLTPQPDGLHISYQGQADPAGKVPHFLTRNVALRTMYGSFQNLAGVLADYQQPYPRIIEYQQ